MSNDYNKDLEVNFDRLDENWRDHSRNYMEWSEKWVNAVAEYDRAKEGLEVVKAEVDMEVRNKDHTKKPTEAAITSMVTTHKNYRAASELLIEANKKANLLKSAKSAFEHHKKALEGLTQLWVNGYWSEPRIPAEAKAKFEKSDYQEKQMKTLNENPRLKRKVVKK